MRFKVRVLIKQLVSMLGSFSRGTSFVQCSLITILAIGVGPREGNAANLEITPALATLLNFEDPPEGTMPAGWRGGPPETLFSDSEMAHSGKRAARIERTPGSPQKFSTFTASVPMNFPGSQIELRGFVRTESVTEIVGLWLREDGESGQLEFNNMSQRPIAGTTEWKEYSIHLPLNAEGQTLFFGVFLAGPGKVWIDDLQLLVDGQPIWAAPKRPSETTILDQDHRFEAGSKIRVAAFTADQIENLGTLARVWGFLKYYHPAVTAGKVHWDYELLRVLPSILETRSPEEANARMVGWIDQLGALDAPAVSAETMVRDRVHLAPDLYWQEDEKILGAELCRRLRAVRAQPRTERAQFYVSLVRGVGNPQFIHELAYPNLNYPDPGFQLLGLFRYWTMIHYWFPYRDLIDENWAAVLAEYIPRIGLAKTAAAYQLEFMTLIARVHDSHANLWSALPLRPPIGLAELPLIFRFIEGKPVVSEVVPGPNTSGDILRGDVLLEMDGTPIEKLISEWLPYYAASNDPTRLRDIARNLGRGPAGRVKLLFQRGEEKREVLSVRGEPLPLRRGWTHDLPGPAFRLLSEEIAYLKLSAVKAEEIADYVKKSVRTKGWIIDVRNYPSEFVVFALGSHLVDQSTKFVCFTVGELKNPGAFHFTEPVLIPPKPPHYLGKLIILVDETTQSQAEYTTMALRAAPGALVVGSTTAGADGNVSQIALPGGLKTLFSGIGVFYPDKRPTQRVGIIPDIEVKPSLKGLREGRDEVLEEAWKLIVGKEPTEEERRSALNLGDR